MSGNTRYIVCRLYNDVPHYFHRLPSKMSIAFEWLREPQKATKYKRRASAEAWEREIEESFVVPMDFGEETTMPGRKMELKGPITIEIGPSIRAYTRSITHELEALRVLLHGGDEPNVSGFLKQCRTDSPNPGVRFAREQALAMWDQLAISLLTATGEAMADAVIAPIGVLFTEGDSAP